MSPGKFTPHEGWVLQAYRYALDPTPRQARALSSHAGAARFAYNWAVRYVMASWAQRQAEESYGIPESELTPWREWSLPSLRRQWNRVKREVAPWWAENSKEAYSSGLACAARAPRSGRVPGAKYGCVSQIDSRAFGRQLMRRRDR